MANINDFIAYNEDMNVEVSPGVSYSLRDIINESYRLYNAKFESEDSSKGFQRIFYRMIWIIYRTIIMSSDIDTKDMNMRSLNGQGINTLALLKLAIRSHLNHTFFGRYLDKVLMELVWFGSSITKRVDGRVETVDLRNYITQANIKDPQQREHAEYIYMSYDEMLSHKEDWEENWSTIEAVWAKMQKQGLSNFTIIEYWTWIEKDGKNRKGCITYLDQSLAKPEDSRNTTDWSPYLELDKYVTPYSREYASERMQEKLGEKEDMFPYEQADFFDVPGRWLSAGCAELLSGIQEHYNEQFNLKRKKDILDLRGIFVHKYSNSSNSLTQEFLDNLETGSVVQMDINEDLQRVIIDTKTSEFIANVDKLYEIMRLIMGVTVQGTGEEMPGSTSATGVKANFASQMTTYDYVKERMNHFLTGLFMNGYFEDVVNEIDAEEMVAITGSPKDLAEMDQKLIKSAVSSRTEKRYNQLKATRTDEDEEGDVTLEEVQQLQDLEDAEIRDLSQQFKVMGDTRWAEIKKSLLEGLKYTVEFFVNSEAFDKQAKLEQYRLMLSDPNFTGSRKSVEDAIFDLTNENPRQFDKSKEEQEQEVEKARQQMMMEQGVVPGPMSSESMPMGTSETMPALGQTL